MICKHILFITFSNESELFFFFTQSNSFKHFNLIQIIQYIFIICLCTVKWLQVLLFNTNYYIQHYPFICTQLNSSKYCYI